ncbi:MAG: hypothetical protein QNJ46_14055 [Leptolyngbyaceae cyanobacterium MO_188.B28]|nr:hypothetical protein [Leptolyngbyaceae cyanobacterium MO_188.B28]
MTRRCDRNRKRSKRRGVYCPIHGCYLDSISRKYSLFADKPEHLQQRGMKRLSALTLIQSYTAIPLTGEWLEDFWCQECQETTWYHVCRYENPQLQGGKYHYKLSPAPESLWRQASGVIQPGGNPSVGEFTRRAARNINYQGVRGFRLIG